jgi:salicylate biosynthesis isochorismate synthase
VELSEPQRIEGPQRRGISAPHGSVWSILAGALNESRPVFAWMRGDDVLLALDEVADLPDGFSYQAWRFDDEERGAPWTHWPATLRRTPAVVVRWTPTSCRAFAQGPFSYWPQAEAIAGRAVGAGESLEDRAAWMRRVTLAEAACRDRDLQKVVLARAVRYAASCSPVASLRALRAAHPNATVFCVNHGAEVFIGATPEKLVEVHGDQLRTHALAGTRHRGEDPREDAALAEALTTCVKERREHAAVVADLADTLAPFCTTLDWPQTPGIRRLATVQHLETPFDGRLRPGARAEHIARTLHPTAALGGLPRDRARDWLRRTEPLDRGYYGAPIGWVDGADAEFAVAIRSALLTADAAYTFAGAGIVAGALPAAEWRETHLKQASVAQALRRVDQ